MTEENKTSKLPPLRHQFVIFWAIFCLIIIAGTDLTMPKLLAQTDYLMTFHTAGHIAAHGLWESMYPPAQATTFAAAPFDKQAHALIPDMPSWSVGEYMYMPASAYIFAPLSMLSLSTSLICWQLISLVALFVGCRLVLGQWSRAVVAGCAAFMFIPLFFTLWIGQVGLVFGLLPLAAGYYLLSKEKYFAAGLVFSLLSLKPQMLFPASFMVALQAGRKQYWPVAGGLTGAALIAAINFALTGGAICLAWLHCMSLSDAIYSDPSKGVNVQLATSLPRAILLSQPLASHATLKPILWAMIVILLVAGWAAAIKLAKSSLSDEARLTYSFVLGALALPLVVPHVFLYDLGALVPAAFLLFFNKPAAEENPVLYRGFRNIVLAEWCIITVYCLALVVNKTFAQPLLLVSSMLIAYLLGIIAAMRAK